MTRSVIDAWHAVVAAPSPEGLDALLADDVVFESPVVHTPQAGKAKTALYLSSAFRVLNNESFRYVGRWDAERSAILEFETTIDGIVINGIDMIDWNDAGRITRFKVMVRPLKAIGVLHERMGAELLRASGRG